MGLRYCFSKDYSNEDIKVALSNVSETLQSKIQNGPRLTDLHNV